MPRSMRGLSAACCSSASRASDSSKVRASMPAVVGLPDSRDASWNISRTNDPGKNIGNDTAPDPVTHLGLFVDTFGTPDRHTVDVYFPPQYTRRANAANHQAVALKAALNSWPDLSPRPEATVERQLERLLGSRYTSEMHSVLKYLFGTLVAF